MLYQSENDGTFALQNLTRGLELKHVIYPFHFPAFWGILCDRPIY